MRVRGRDRSERYIKRYIERQSEANEIACWETILMMVLLAHGNRSFLKKKSDL